MWAAGDGEVGSRGWGDALWGRGSGPAPCPGDPRCPPAAPGTLSVQGTLRQAAARQPGAAVGAPHGDFRSAWGGAEKRVPLCAWHPRHCHPPGPGLCGAVRGCGGLQEQEQEQEQRQEQEQPRSVRPRGGGAGVRGGQEGAGEGGAGPGGTHRELEVLGQQVLELGDALVDAVAPLLLDEPVGQLVGLLRGAVPGERSARPPRGARRAPGTGGGGFVRVPHPLPRFPRAVGTGLGAARGSPAPYLGVLAALQPPPGLVHLVHVREVQPARAKRKQPGYPRGPRLGGRGGEGAPLLRSSPLLLLLLLLPPSPQPLPRHVAALQGGQLAQAGGRGLRAGDALHPARCGAEPG